MQRIPDWLKIGALIDCGIFCGLVTDLATSERGVILVYVESMKEARRGPVGGEWLPYAEEQMRLASAERMQDDADYNYTALVRANHRMNAFSTRIGIAKRDREMAASIAALVAEGEPDSVTG